MAGGPQATKVSDPPWKGLTGDRRIQREFRSLRKLVDAGGAPQVAGVDFVDDSIRRWSLKLKNFDNDVPGGRQLNRDLAELARRHGQDHLALDITFPEDYPQQPFFVRVVTPRCRWYTGHVTAGGSICIEALTLSGTPNSWQPDYCVESMLNVIMHNMVHCEEVYVRTPTGPGGLSGPLRIDLELEYTTSVMQPYTEHEAQSAFRRMEANHQRFGWGSGGAAGAGGLGQVGNPSAGSPNSAPGVKGVVIGGAGGASGSGARDGGMALVCAAPVGILNVASWAVPLTPVGTGASGAVVAAGMPMQAAMPLCHKNNFVFRGSGGPASSRSGGMRRLGGRMGALKSSLPKDASQANAVITGGLEGSYGTARQARKAHQKVAGAKTGAQGGVAGGSPSKRSAVGKNLQNGPQSLVGAATHTWTPASSSKAMVARMAPTDRGQGALSPPISSLLHTLACLPLPQVNSQGAAGAGSSTLSVTPPPLALNSTQQSPEQRGSEGPSASVAGTPPRAIVAFPTRKRRRSESSDEGKEGQGQGHEVIDLTFLEEGGNKHKQSPGTRKKVEYAALVSKCGSLSLQGDDVGGVTSLSEDDDDPMAPDELLLLAKELNSMPKEAQQEIRNICEESVVDRQGTSGEDYDFDLSKLDRSTLRRLATYLEEWQLASRREKTKLRAENDDLKGQVERLQKELDEAKAKPHAVDPPAHWSNVSRSRQIPVHYVDLYRHGAGMDVHKMEVELDAEGVSTMTQYGISREDAVAALGETGGDVNAAFAFHIDCLEQGGAAAAVDLRHKTTRGREEEEELVEVLKRFEEGNTTALTRLDVVCVQRVENLRLWGKYQARVADIVDTAGEDHLNEKSLWHGADLETLETISREGFDHRVSNLNGALGAGVYFSETTEYSHNYSKRAPHSADPQAVGSSSNFSGLPGYPRGLAPWLPSPPPTFASPLAGASTSQFAQALGAAQGSAPAQLQVPPTKKSLDDPVYAMLLCRVALGRTEEGYRGLRRPPNGADSVCGKIAMRGFEPVHVYAIFDNGQAYPEYLVYYQ